MPGDSRHAMMRKDSKVHSIAEATTRQVVHAESYPASKLCGKLYGKLLRWHIQTAKSAEL